ncbi:MAG TPA: hypothetical protein VF760_00595 [Xanthobacteraceae bacterium]
MDIIDDVVMPGIGIACLLLGVGAIIFIGFAVVAAITSDKTVLITAEWSCTQSHTDISLIVTPKDSPVGVPIHEKVCDQWTRK